MSNKASGILKLNRKGAGSLYDPAWTSHEVYVPAGIIREHNIPQGARVAGTTRRGKQGPLLATVEQIGGVSPEAFRARTPFNRLVPIDPADRLNLGAAGEESMRVIDLVAPIGKGTRGLIVSPPKAGKTLMLEQIAAGVQADAPDTRVVVLLVDERPEEVTHFRRVVQGEVFASSSDGSIRQHTELTELMLAHIRIELECGRDVVLLLDSLTRMVRAFNRQVPGGRHGRTMSGGLDAAALEIPRRFFGLARNIEGGGSVTIIASALIETGSRMDQLIFEEFKGTGNSEIVLDRELAQAYLYPAVNIAASGTRKDQHLYEPAEYQQLVQLRRSLSGRPTAKALKTLLDLIRQTPSNEQLLARFDR